MQTGAVFVRRDVEDRGHGVIVGQTNAVDANDRYSEVYRFSLKLHLYFGWKRSTVAFARCARSFAWQLLAEFDVAGDQRPDTGLIVTD
jgi:hypothetical protein